MVVLQLRPSALAKSQTYRADPQLNSLSIATLTYLPYVVQPPPTTIIIPSCGRSVKLFGNQ